MNEFDRNILIVSENICKNIASITDDDRGFKSQNILNNLRHLVEAVDQRIYSEKATITLNKYDDIERSVAYVASRGELKFLNRFHYFLQAAVSHFIPDEDGATRLMLKYYEWLLRIREYMKNSFGLDILQNLEDYPLDQDDSLVEYYEKIAFQLDHVRYSDRAPSDRFYVQKSKMFFFGGRIYYEITVIPADDYSSKFNRFTVFSKKEIPTYYAIKLNFIDTEIEILERRMPIRVIDNYKVAIRPVEFEDFSRIINMPKVNAGTIEYNSMMEYLTVSGMSLTELVTMNDEYYDAVKTEIQNLSRSNNLFNSLDRCRQLIKSAAPGSNILRYVLLKMRHHIMKYQIADRPNNWISYLCLWNECLPFDKMPFDASLVYHNPSLFDVFSCISSKGREHEILSRKIRINTEQNVQLFTPTKDVEHIGDVEELANKFNSLLIPKHIPVRSLVIEKDKVYIKGYEADTVSIINDLISRVGSGLTGYRNAMDAWLQATPAVDCDEKKTILQDMFSKYDLALIYGAAGTGKTTLIKHLSSYFADSSKLFLANTNPAKENLRRQIKVSNSEFSTIASCGPLVSGHSYDIVFIDECSTVDNYDMNMLLNNSENYDLLLLVGDVYQIESIKYVNWFQICSRYFKSGISFELEMTHRTTDEELLKLWNCVRKNDKAAINIMSSKEYSEDISPKIFERTSDEEIILCLNYDGMYGINNINKVMQNSNKNREYTLGVDVFKVDDPVLFNDCPRFNKFTHNNLKGIIKEIEEDASKEAMWFCIEIDEDSIDIGNKPDDVTLLKSDKKGKIIVKFKVKEFKDKNDDENEYDHIIPFNLAYAISIHKAQGLEYDSVKIVITSNIEDRITKNIFYTAITRTKNKLKVYWNSATQEKIFDSFDKNESKRDLGILNQKIRQL